MEAKDCITIAAVLFSPLIAVQVEKFIERIRSNKSRKVQIFKTLMATRGSRLSIEHVTALNQIDLEFYGKKKYLKVIRAWKEYLDQLFLKWNNDDEFRIWNNRTEELLANLLFEMGLPLGFNFDKVTIKRSVYSPIGHAKVEDENQQIRNLLIKVLNGENSINTFQVFSDDVVEINKKSIDKTGELQSLLIDHYKNGTPINVNVTRDEKSK
jgi:hypothetical protein